jgi:hypothetical protein
MVLMTSLIFKAEQYGKKILESQDINPKSVNNLPNTLVFTEKKSHYYAMNLTNQKQKYVWCRVSLLTLAQMLMSNRLQILLLV